VGVVKSSYESGWDSVDQDTPSILTNDVYRNSFPNNQVWLYYAGFASGEWATGLLIEPDVNYAFNDGLTKNWLRNEAQGPGSNPTGGNPTKNISVVENGRLSLKLPDTLSNEYMNYSITINNETRATVGVWMRRTTGNIGDYDIIASETDKTLFSFGLGSNGRFHYWNGAFVDTPISYSPNTWYFVTASFDTATDKYNFVVYNTSFSEILRINNISFGNTGNYVDHYSLYTSDEFVADGFADAFRVYSFTEAVKYNFGLGEEI
jgi:hypothetical protein